MKKVLSVLLAVCMLAALAVPAFAWGADADVVKAEFDKAEYSLNDILNDDGAINVAELLTCYDKNGNRTCFDEDGKTVADIRAFNSSNNEVLTLNGAGTVTKIMNERPYDVKITLSVTLASNVRASTVIVVPANADSTNGGDAYGYRLGNAEVAKGSNITVAADGATISYNAKAAAVAGNLSFYSETSAAVGTLDAKTVGVNAGDSATDVADAIRTGVTTLIINGVTYNVDADGTGAKVVWKAAAGELPDTKELTKAQKAVTFAPTTDLEIVKTTDGTADVKAVFTLTTQAANGATAVKLVLGGKTYTIGIEKNYDAIDVAAAIANFFKNKTVTILDKSSTAVKVVCTAEQPVGARNTVVFTAKDVGVTDDIGTTETANLVFPSVGEIAYGNGADASTPDPLKYNIGDEITPILASYSFTDAQKAGFEFAIRVATGNNSKYADVRAGDPLHAYGLIFELGEDADGFPQLIVYDDPGDPDDETVMAFKPGTYVYGRVLNKEFANAQIEKEFRIKLVNPASTAATNKILPVEKTIGVGQELDLTTLHSSVKDVKTYWTVEPYGDYQTKTEADLAAKIIINGVNADDTYGWVVKGLAPSVVTIKIYDSYKDLQNGVAADSMKLNIGRGTVSGPSINTTSASVKVGETVALNVKTTTADQYVKWAVSNENGTLDVLEGASVKLTGKTEGNVVVTATVYEAKDSTVVEKTLTATVEVKAAEAPAEGTTATQNPQTGDSIFAHLFF